MLLENTCLLCWRCLILLSTLTISASSILRPDAVSTLSGNIIDLDGASKEWFSTFLQSYRDAGANSTSINTYELNKLSQNTSTSLTNRLFRPRRTALEKTARKAQAKAAAYGWSNSSLLTEDTVDYIDAQQFKDYYNKYDRQPDEEARFGRSVNFSFSSVFVPVELYRGERPILEALDWTSSLEDLFKENYENSVANPDEDEYLWQYFGSQTGLVRTYPASEWPVKSGVVDLYDSRRRPWYIQGANSPKDVLILIDTSGSTVGQILYLEQLTVMKIMETLSEDDYIHVAHFSSEEIMGDGANARLGPPCFNSFVQATALNKDAIMDYVRDFDEPRGQANYTVGLEYAFKTFEEFEKQRDILDTGNGPGNSGISANCSKIIIILTDGGIEKPEKLISDYDPNNDKYRIFTYAMGQAPTPLDAVRWLACRNRGYFSKVQSIGTIHAGIEGMNQYIGDVMAGEAASKGSLLSPIYRDKLGLGMLTTLTMPIVNTSVLSQATLLGVMAIDIAISEFEQYIQFDKLGPLGYVFVINHNGFVIYHPELRPQEEWNTQPPSIDLLDLEAITELKYEGEINQVREAMLQKQATNILVTHGGSIYSNGQNPAYYYEYKKSYQTIDVEGAAYRLCTVSPVALGQKYLEVNNYTEAEIDFEVFDDMVGQQIALHVPQWKYCDKMYRLYNYSSLLKDFKSLVTNDSITCDKNLLAHLLFDASLINSSSLTDLFANGSSSRLLSVSITSAGGLTTMYPAPEDDDKYFHVGTYFSNQAIKRAHQTPQLFVFTADYTQEMYPVNENDTGPAVSVYKAIDDGDENQPFVYAVVGMTFLGEVIATHLEGLTDDNGDALCGYNTTVDSYRRCYLLDEGGIIVASNFNHTSFSWVGQWIGRVDPSLMYVLFNESDSSTIYNRHKHVDYQATCIYNWTQESSSSASNKLPRIYQVMEMAFMQVSTFVSMITSGWLFTGWGSGEAAAPLAYGLKYVTCIKQSYQYYYRTAEVNPAPLSLEFDYEQCARSVEVARLESTNLLLVIADAPEVMCAELPPLPQAPVQVTLEDLDKEDYDYTCQRHMRNRERPSTCAFSNHEANSYPCSGCHLQFDMVLLMLTLTLTKYLVGV